MERAQQAVELDPFFQDARYNLGWILKKMGRKKEALQVWRELLEVVPENKMAQRALREAGVKVESK